jgi:hypothetical protein
MGLLEVPTPDFEALNVRGGREDRHTIVVGIVEAIDQMEIPRSATLFFAITVIPCFYKYCPADLSSMARPFGARPSSSVRT